MNFRAKNQDPSVQIRHDDLPYLVFQFKEILTIKLLLVHKKALRPSLSTFWVKRNFVTCAGNRAAAQNVVSKNVGGIWNSKHFKIRWMKREYNIFINKFLLYKLDNVVYYTWVIFVICCIWTQWLLYFPSDFEFENWYFLKKDTRTTFVSATRFLKSKNESN